MELRTCSVAILLICSSLSWVVSSSLRVKPPPAHNIMLAFSSEVSSLSEGNGKIHSKSLSPWKWRPSTVKNRIPSTLWEAECISNFCTSPSPGQIEAQDLLSVPIYQNILVLTCSEGGDNYTASFQSVAVGCTCIRSVTNQN